MEQVKQDNESDDTQSDVIQEASVPVILTGLRDQAIKLASPFSLSVTVENADSVTWLLEQQVIVAEPEEGLVLRQNGNNLMLILYIKLILKEMNIYWKFRQVWKKIWELTTSFVRMNLVKRGQTVS